MYYKNSKNTIFDLEAFDMINFDGVALLTARNEGKVIIEFIKGIPEVQCAKDFFDCFFDILVSGESFDYIDVLEQMKRVRLSSQIQKEMPSLLKRADEGLEPFTLYSDDMP